METEHITQFTKSEKYLDYQRQYQREYQKNAYHNNVDIRNKKKIKYYLNKYKDVIPILQDIADNENLSYIEKLQQIIPLIGVYRITRNSI